MIARVEVEWAWESTYCIVSTLPSGHPSTEIMIMLLRIFELAIEFGRSDAPSGTTHTACTPNL